MLVCSEEIRNNNKGDASEGHRLAMAGYDIDAISYVLIQS